MTSKNLVRDVTEKARRTVAKRMEQIDQQAFAHEYARYYRGVCDRQPCLWCRRPGVRGNYFNPPPFPVFVD